MNYTYNGVAEQNGRLVFDDLSTYHAVLDSLAKNDSTYFANNLEPDLVDANGYNIVGENPLLDDFENAFPNFTSHRKDIEVQEVNTLNSGSINLPERLWLDPFISTTLNNDLEVQINAFSTPIDETKLTDCN